MVAHCFEGDPCELLARVHDRHPVWTRLELAKGAQDNFRMRRHPGTTRFFIRHQMPSPVGTKLRPYGIRTSAGGGMGGSWN
jgi:hypothetical protein